MVLYSELRICNDFEYIFSLSSENNNSSLPVQMIVHESDHGVLDGGLLGVQTLVHVLAQLLADRLDDELTVRDLFAVVLGEGQKSALGPEFIIVVHILEKKQRRNMLEKGRNLNQISFNFLPARQTDYPDGLRVYLVLKDS